MASKVIDWSSGEKVVRDALPGELDTPAPTERDIRAEAARRLQLIATPYTAEERETWPTQVKGAEALQADPDASALLVRDLAAEGGVTPQEMASEILAKATAYEAAAATILAGQRRLLSMQEYPQDYRDDKHWSAT